MKKVIVTTAIVASVIGVFAFWPSLVKSSAGAFVFGGPEMYRKISGNHATFDYCKSILPEDRADDALQKCYEQNRNKF